MGSREDVNRYLKKAIAETNNVAEVLLKALKSGALPWDSQKCIDGMGWVNDQLTECAKAILKLNGGRDPAGPYWAAYRECDKLAAQARLRVKEIRAAAEVPWPWIMGPLGAIYTAVLRMRSDLNELAGGFGGAAGRRIAAPGDSDADDSGEAALAGFPWPGAPDNEPDAEFVENP